MTCPLCGQRKARRDCPAVGRVICSVCCGTKRLVEINCPATCVHLAAAREHPAAVVRRQQDRDAAVLVPTIQHLTERQHQLFFLFQTAIARYKPEGFTRLVDEDVAQATGALASTLETSARGVIYEHAATSLPAQRLTAELKNVLDQIARQGARVFDREAAIVLRAIEKGARSVAADGESAYLTMMARLLQSTRIEQDAAAAQEAKPTSSLIIP